MVFFVCNCYFIFDFSSELLFWLLLSDLSKSSEKSDIPYIWRRSSSPSFWDCSIVLPNDFLNFSSYYSFILLSVCCYSLDSDSFDGIYSSIFFSADIYCKSFFILLKLNIICFNWFLLFNIYCSILIIFYDSTPWPRLILSDICTYYTEPEGCDVLTILFFLVFLYLFFCWIYSFLSSFKSEWTL